MLKVIEILFKITTKCIFGVCLTVILKSVFILKNIFEKKLSIWENLGNNFKNLKNYLYF